MSLPATADGVQSRAVVVRLVHSSPAPGVTVVFPVAVGRLQGTEWKLCHGVRLASSEQKVTLELTQSA